MASIAKTIGTHSGTFHCDEALACWMLKHTNEFRDATIIRTREPNLLKELDILVDVGGIYGNSHADPTTKRFDHHQASFKDTFGGKYNKVRLSSAGLVYKHYGLEVLRNLTQEQDEQLLNSLYDRLYSDFILSVDAIDNGVNQYETTEQPEYKDSTTLCSRVARLNPSWNRPDINADVQFIQAMELAGTDFISILFYLKDSVFSARTVVERAFNSRFSVHPSGRIMLLDPRCPWKDHLVSIESEHNCPEDQKIYFAIYFDNRLWMVHAMSITASSFTSRRNLNKSWHGLREQELQSISGVPDSEFIHTNGFIGGAWSFEGALSLAIKSMERKIFIGGLASVTTTEQLKSYFQQFGAIESCTTVQDRFTGQSRCFGFIITDQKETANKILSRIHQIDGKTVECKPALPKLEGKGTIKERKIFVGGLCTDVTDGEFRDFFEKYGKLEDCIVMRDKESGRPRGFGFITFSEEKAARKVIYNYHHNRIRGNWIDCKKATPKLKIRKLSDRTPTGEDKNELMTGFEKITTDLSLQNCSADELPSAASIERYIEKLLLDDDL